MTIDVVQFAIVLGVVTALVVVLGKWMTRLFTHPAHTLLERGTYRLLGVDPSERRGWQRYGMVLVLSNAAMMLLGYLLAPHGVWRLCVGTHPEEVP